METAKIDLDLDHDDEVQMWQRSGHTRTLTLGRVTVDMPVEKALDLHAQAAVALSLPCRPRTIEEQLAGVTRRALGLLEEPDAIWVLVTDVENVGVNISIHATEDDAIVALIERFEVPHDVPNDEVVQWVIDAVHAVIYLDSHNLAA